MKPIVIVTDGNGKVIMTVEELKKVLDDAFEQGKAAGTTNIHTHTNTYRGWWNEPYYNQVLCSSNCNLAIQTENTTE